MPTQYLKLYHILFSLIKTGKYKTIEKLEKKHKLSLLSQRIKCLNRTGIRPVQDRGKFAYANYFQMLRKLSIINVEKVCLDHLISVHWEMFYNLYIWNFVFLFIQCGHNKLNAICPNEACKVEHNKIRLFDDFLYSFSVHPISWMLFVQKV